MINTKENLAIFIICLSNFCSICLFLCFSVAAKDVVYDYIDPSPNYDNTPNDLYIDERELIELPAASQQETG